MTVNLTYVDTGPRSNLALDCHSEYDPATQQYKVIGNWSLSNPLVRNIDLEPEADLFIKDIPRRRIPNYDSFVSTTVRSIS